jgi:hypothetical protein
MTGGKVDQKAEFASPLCTHAPSKDFVLDFFSRMEIKEKLQTLSDAFSTF